MSSTNAPEHPVALVTGGSGGLGQALAIELDQLGCRVAIHYNSGRDSALAVQSKLVNSSMVVTADIGCWHEVEAMHESIVDQLGAVDVVVNNAAVRKDGLMAMQSPAEWRRVIDTNLMGTFHTARAALPAMLRRRWGRIINIVSPSGIIATSGQTAYSASKAGVIGLTRTLASECGRRGVTVNALSPGFMDTAMTTELPARVKQGMLDRLPIPRFTTPYEVANAIRVFIDNDYITGQCLSVDGGISIT
jgi:3-oxoacyl-[acyl-carrier protein] reductase